MESTSTFTTRFETFQEVELLSVVSQHDAGFDVQVSSRFREPEGTIDTGR